MRSIFTLLFSLLFLCGYSQSSVVTSGYGFAKYQPVEVFFEDLESQNSGNWDQAGVGVLNPWTQVKFDVAFFHPATSKIYEVRGAYAADGNAAHTGATSGNWWKATFIPPDTGMWIANVSWKIGYGGNINLQKPFVGPVDETYIDNLSFYVKDSVSGISEFDIHGPVYHDPNYHYPRHLDGSFWMPTFGSDSRENRLAYQGFMDTEAENDGKKDNYVLDYSPHFQDTVSTWFAPIPTWDTVRGIFGEAIYLDSKGAKYISFLTNNMNGDGDNVWPYIEWSNPANNGQTPEQFNFNVSKLERWQDYINFLRRYGFIVEFKLWETENDRKFTPASRAAYLNVTGAYMWDWYPGSKVNLGEENDWNDEYVNGVDSIKKYFDWIVDEYQYDDVYPNITVVHTYANNSDREDTYQPLQSYPTFSGPSLQIGNHRAAGDESRIWIDYADQGTRKWLVSVDENGPYQHGVPTDVNYPGYNSSVGYTQESILYHWVWEAHFAQAWESAFYYGYQQDPNDLECEDQRSRDHIWSMSGYVDNFWSQVPWWDMVFGGDSLCGDNDHWVLAYEDSIYAYLNKNDNNDDFVIKLPSALGWELIMYDIYNGNWFTPISFGPNTYPVDANGFTHIPFNGQCEVAALIVRTGSLSGNLPVRFLNAGIKKYPAGVYLHWEVIDENGVSEYEVRRKDGDGFTRIGVVNADSLTFYDYVDYGFPDTDELFYQIRAVDGDPNHYTDSDILYVTTLPDCRVVYIQGNPVRVPVTEDWYLVDITSRRINVDKNIAPGIYWVVSPRKSWAVEIK